MFSEVIMNLTKINFLEIFPKFRKSSDHFFTDILTISLRKTFPENMRIYSEKDVCSSIAFVLSGEVRVYKKDDRGREITLYEIGRGETCILTASCILSNTLFPAKAESVMAGEMLLLPAADFRRMVSTYEEMRNFVFNLISQRLASIMMLIEEIVFGKMDERLLDYLIEKSEHGNLPATHQKIAGDLGTSREVVSRLLKDFEKKGKVILSRGMIQLIET